MLGTWAHGRDGTLTCWGDRCDSYAGGPGPRPTAFARLVPCSGSLCGLRADGTYACWGDFVFDTGTFLRDRG
jgi:hypothetical protein